MNKSTNLKSKIVLINRNAASAVLALLIGWMLFFLSPCTGGDSGLYAAEPEMSDIMKLSEIKPGMIGEGKTIFKGTEIETFKFKVLGVLEKFVPDKNMIIVELESPVLAEAGIIAGMSGSPAYIDGKIIGSISYGFAFSKRPIGGITPIEDIIKTDEYNNPTFTIDISDIKIQFDKENIKSITDFLQKELTRRINYTPLDTLTPIQLMGIQKGMDPTVLSPLTPLLSPAGSFKDFNQDQFDARNLKIDRKMFAINAADAAAIPLIRGDFEYSASGTVTYVKGSKVYMFGHPFFNLGTVDFPLHKAEVITVVPSYQSSFKITATRNPIGAVLQDRLSAVQADLDHTPYMIPIKVFLENRNRTFNLEVVNHPLLTPILASVSLDNIFSSEYKQFGFSSLRVKGTIFIENEKNIIIDDLFSGINASDEFGGLLLAINFFLMNNKDRTIKIQKMDFEIDGSERVSSTAIENVILNKQAFYPGELIDIRIHLKNERGNEPVEQMQITAPNLKSGSEFYLMVAGKNEMIRFETKNIKSDYFPISLNTLIRAINNIRKNNRIYLKLMTPGEGIFIKGNEYSNLPVTMNNVFSYNATSEDQTEMKFSTITEYQYPVPAVVTGTKLFKLKIKARSDTDVQ
ncbi:MAG: Peptidase protein [Acidobacteriota bacterium]|nr:Peptidase protein [Acidobacteriota bacterium]